MVKREYFSFSAEKAQFDKAFTALIAKLARLERAKIIPTENVMQYSHGVKWVAVSSDSSDEESQMSTHTTEALINMQDVREHNLEALPALLRDIVGKMNDSLQKTIYQTQSESCEKSGNTISAKDYETSADAFLATMKKIEFGVDKEGKVSRPEFHVSPETFDKFQKEAEAQGQNFKNKVEKVIEEKSKAALEREKLRRARFKTQ